MTVDYVGVAWLDAGRRASNAVARISGRDGSYHGPVEDEAGERHRLASGRQVFDR